MNPGAGARCSPEADDVFARAVRFDRDHAGGVGRPARGSSRQREREEAKVASYEGSRVAGDAYPDAARGAGWLTFASIMLLIAGIWNVIEGLLAIGSSRVFVNDEVFVVSDLKTWGWIVTLLGVLQLTAAWAVMSGRSYGRWFGIAVAGINAIGQLLFLPAYPLWCMAMFAVDVLIVYGLAVYGPRGGRAE
jgi:hypothetical protein